MNMKIKSMISGIIVIGAICSIGCNNTYNDINKSKPCDKNLKVSEEIIETNINDELIMSNDKSKDEIGIKTENDKNEVTYYTKEIEYIEEDDDDDDEVVIDTQDIVIENEIRNDNSIENKIYTQEDYDNYINYRDNLISEYGEDIYQLMNQEAGIQNEQESFEYYMQYGK